MEEIRLSLQAIAIVGSLLTALAIAISVLSGAVAMLYRQVLKERDRTLDERNRVLEERDARLVDLWRELEAKEIRITALEGANERWQRLAADATAGWKAAVEETRTRAP